MPAEAQELERQSVRALALPAARRSGTAHINGILMIACGGEQMPHETFSGGFGGRSISPR